MLIFSTHERKFVWYLPKKVNLNYLKFLLFPLKGKKLTFFLVVSSKFCLAQRVKAGIILGGNAVFHLKMV